MQTIINKIRIVLADDHIIFRKGVKTLLENEAEIVIVAEASDGIEALKYVKEVAPDIILMDISMPGMTGIEVAAILSQEHPQTKSLILSMYNNEDYVLKSVESGAQGYLLKDTTKEEILKALRTVASGGKYFSATVSQSIVNGYLNKSGNKSAEVGSPLSVKEKAILKLIVEGLNSKKIAERLNLSVRTVDNHRANMMKKINVKNAAELVKYAIVNKLA